MQCAAAAPYCMEMYNADTYDTHIVYLCTNPLSNYSNEWIYWLIATTHESERARAAQLKRIKLVGL